MTRPAEAPPPALGVAHSLAGRRWVWREAPDRLAQALAQRHALPEIVGRLLAARGIDADTAADFLAPTLRALLPDPAVLVDMQAAAERLAAAVRAGETVAVFGDYDVDGACSTALMVSALRGLGCTVLSHIPDRMAEGYGPNAPALLALLARGASLVVCVDCGTAAAEALGCLHGRADVVVLDHHTCDHAPPAVLATVNPNRLDCRSGLRALCAAAVTFLALVATVRVLRRTGWFAGRDEPDLLGLLDLVALATVCDVMPLVGVNRALVVQGLRVMARRARPGIAALLDVAQVQGAPSAMSLGYALGPRINAAGRIDDAGLGVRLLLAEDPDEARALAERLDGINRERRSVEAAVLDAAMHEAAAQVEAGRAALLVSGDAWHAGVVGIVAGRIRERFNRPACVAAVADGIARGSGRSVPGHDLGAAIIAARHRGLLTAGGGHAQAAGFALPQAGLDALHAHLCERLATAALLPAAADLAIEGALSAAGCTAELAAEVSRLAPFGAGNEEPILVLRHVRVVRADRVGRELSSIRAFVEGAQDGARMKAMVFRARDDALATALLSRDGEPLHLAGHLRLDSWNGREGISFAVVDAARA